MDEEVLAIKKNAFTVARYMRGAITYEDALNLSSTERKLVNEIVDEAIDITKKSGMPLL